MRQKRYGITLQEIRCILYNLPVHGKIIYYSDRDFSDKPWGVNIWQLERFETRQMTF